MRKILVLRGGALGDFIVTLPALALLRQRWPTARIELVGNAAAAQLGRTCGLLDFVHSQHAARWSGLFGESPLPAELDAWLAEFDLVVNYWPDPDGDLTRRFPLRGGQTFLTAPAMPVRTPAAAHFCEPLRVLGLGTNAFLFRLVAASVSERRSESDPLAHARSYIAIHPGSGSAKKNWPSENWIELISRLPAPVTLILGEAECPTWNALCPTGVTVLRSPPLEELVGHLARCRLFLGHDSGISHLAAASGAPSVLLFGPTDPAMWAPPAPNVTVLRSGPALSSIAVDDVHCAVLAALADQR